MYNPKFEPMKKSILFLTLLTLLTLSCSKSDDENSVSASFRFLEFEKDILLPSINEREITFLAIDFDPNIGSWNLTLTDGQKDIPVTLNQVETTNLSWVTTSSFLQRIYLTIPAIDTGDYTLTIANITTGQTYKDIFLVRDNVFNKIEPVTSTSYTIDYEVDKTEDYLYFQNTTNTITEGITTTGIQKVVLEKEATFESFTLGHEVLANGYLTFTIPPSIPVGTYYLSIKYDNGLSSYFEKDIVVLKEQLPSVNLINKDVFSGGETLVLTGKDFRYEVDETLLPTNGLSSIKTWTYLIFRDVNREYEFSFGAYETDENYENINSEATELKYTIPVKADSFMFTDVDKTYFEGEVFIRSGAYTSNAVPVRVNY